MSKLAISSYQAYKVSDSFWLGDIPEEWSCQQLKYVADLSTEKVIPSASVRYVGMENVRSGDGSFVNTDDQEPEGLSLSFANSDVLFGKLRPYLAKSWLASFSGICSSEFLVLGTRKVSPRFLNYTTLSREFISIVDSSTYGAKMPRASWDFIGMLKVPVPDFGTSVQIARFLDYETAKIDALIEKQQQLIALLKEKRQAVISHAVTKGLNPDAPMRASGVEWLGEVPTHWEVSRLKHISRVIDCRNKTPEYFDDGEYFVIRTTNVKEQELLLDDSALRTDQKNFDIWTQRGVPPVGSILFTREAPAGEVCLVPPDAKLCMGQRMMNFIPFSDSHVGYLFSYLLSDCLTRYIGSVSLGSTVSHLRVDQVENITVPVPPEGEAAAISAHVIAMRTKMRDLISVSERKIELLQERRAALISAAVTGKIDVRKWQSPDDN